MFTCIVDTKGIPGSCALQQIFGEDTFYSRCRATKNFCVVAKDDPSTSRDLKDVECPFAKHSVIQLEYRKQIDD